MPNKRGVMLIIFGTIPPRALLDVYLFLRNLGILYHKFISFGRVKISNTTLCDVKCTMNLVLGLFFNLNHYK